MMLPPSGGLDNRVNCTGPGCSMAALQLGRVALCNLSTNVTRCLGGSLTGALWHTLVPSGSSSFHTCSILEKSMGKRMIPKEPTKWPKYNEVVYPPRGPEEPIRPAEVYHYRANIKYGPKKMWYIASMIRGMSIDEALKQLQFVKRAGAVQVKEVLLEAQELAVREHNVEYKSNLWVAESFSRQSKIIYGLRKHGRGRYGQIHYRYLHYFVCLREGRPPKHYWPQPDTGHQKIAQYIEDMRQRHVRLAL